ncbi:MAG: hypothetical protein LBC99_01230 [Spirochaetota bacterium]|jgi:hypothetical protein|nr:hypothetical protein [Spirochaetota bacterium]
MADEKNHTLHDTAQKRRGHSRWMKKRFQKQGNSSRAEAQQSEDTKKNRFQKNVKHEHRPALEMVNGRLVRKDRIAQRVNMPQELDKTYRDAKAEIQNLKQAKQDCALCNGVIDDMLTAIPYNDEEHKLCHFECVQKKLTACEQISQNESLNYIGNGDFCIVQERRNRGKPYYFFRKRIHYANPEKTRK